MSEIEIKDLLNTIQSNIPYDYCRSEGTEDNLYQNWLDEDSWQYKTLNYIEQLRQENQQLKENNQAMQLEMARTWEKLNRRDEVIDEANNLITNYLCSEEYCGLDVPLIGDFFMNLKKILQKYKGDNK